MIRFCHFVLLSFLFSSFLATYVERTIGDLPLLQPYSFFFFFSFLFFFFLLALDLSRFFISLLFFYLLEVCTGRDWRLDILSF